VNSLGEFQLSSVFPNPFNNVARINFTIPQSGWVRLEVTDIGGKSVAVIQDGYLASGEYSNTFEGKLFPSGLYFCRLHFAGEMEVRKMVLLK
jgi:hypothetical protein